MVNNKKNDFIVNNLLFTIIIVNTKLSRLTVSSQNIMTNNPNDYAVRQLRNTLPIYTLFCNQVVLFIRKLKEILDKCPECKNKYELVPIGDDNQIADVLVQKIKDADVPMEAETND